MVLTTLPLFAGKNKKVMRPTITTQSVIEYKKTFPDFLKNKEKEFRLLEEWTGDSWWGSVCKFAIESLAPMLGLGDVKVSEAKTFLGRLFSDKQTMDATVESFEKNSDNIAFLQKVFEKVDDTTLYKKSRPGMIAVMHETRHPLVDTPKNIGKMDNNGSYEIPDTKFYPFAISNLMAFHILEGG